jgi:hypothetical protein
MKTRKIIVAGLALLMLLAQPAWAPACPSCAEAPIASGGDDDDQNLGNPQAYNNSIYVMVGVPYACLAVVAVLIYRGVKKNEQFRMARGLSGEPMSQLET